MSVIQDFGVNGSFGVTVGGTGTTVKYFPAPLGPSIGVAPAAPSTTNMFSMLKVPGQNRLNGTFFTVNVVGNFISPTGGGGDTGTVKLYAVTATVAGTYVITSIATTTGATLAAGTAQSFAIKASLFGDSTSGKVGGSYSPYLQGALGTAATTDAVLSNINFNTGNVLLPGSAPFGLVVGVTFSTGTASNSATLTEFNIDAA